ncbi:MAG: biopolymer transporter ExbD [Planctomycetes bacterium]|nr:biopolymer transporter ExbD [Planctomycetota bacterium]
MDFTDDQSGSPEGRRDSRLELQFAPMIDIVFLLLIFFLTTTAMTLPESRLSPALETQQSSDGIGSEQDMTPQVLEARPMDGRPVYVVGSRVVTDRHELVALLEQLPKEPGLLVTVDDSVPIGFAASALQCARDAGFDKVTYVPSEL